MNTPLDPSKAPGRKAKLPARCSLTLSAHFPVWVKLWVTPPAPLFDPHYFWRKQNKSSRNPSGALGAFLFHKNGSNGAFRSIASPRSFPVVGQVVGHGGMASTYWSNKGATLPHGLTQISLHLFLCKRSTIPPAPFYCTHSIPKPVFFLTDCLLTAPRNTSGPTQILRRCKQKRSRKILPTFR